jgi:hypothetical protein
MGYSMTPFGTDADDPMMPINYVPPATKTHPGAGGYTYTEDPQTGGYQISKGGQDLGIAKPGTAAYDSIHAEVTTGTSLWQQPTQVAAKGPEKRSLPALSPSAQWSMDRVMGKPIPWLQDQTATTTMDENRKALRRLILSELRKEADPYGAIWEQELPDLEDREEKPPIPFDPTWKPAPPPEEEPIDIEPAGDPDWFRLGQGTGQGTGQSKGPPPTSTTSTTTAPPPPPPKPKPKVWTKTGTGRLEKK